MNESRVLSLEKISSLNKISSMPLLGIIYGSKQKTSDLDIFLIYDFPVEKNVFIDNYDLNQIEKNNFSFKLFNKDVEYTDPILTGEYFIGNEQILQEAKYFVLNKPVEKNSFDYLTKRSIETFLQAKELYSSGKIELFNRLAMNNEDGEIIKKKIFLEDFKFKSEIINKSLSVLTYSLSYLSSIKRYKEGDKFITIHQISKYPKNEIERDFCSLRDYFKDCSKGNRLLSFKEIDSHFENTKYLINRNT